MAIAYSYVRFSTPGQAGGSSLTRQLQAAKAWAAQHGCALDDSLRDLGTSAFKGDHRRGALGAFLTAIEQGRVARGSILIIEAMDRLSREEVLDAVSLLTGIIQAGVTVVTLDDKITYTRETLHQQQHLFYVLIGKMQQANNYSQNLSARVLVGKRNGRAARIEGGHAVNKVCPAWLRVVTDANGKPRYEEIPDRVKVVRWIFEQVSNDVSIMNITQQLNQRGVPVFDRAGQGLNAKREAGRGWYSSYVQLITRNPAVIGDFRPIFADPITGSRAPSDKDSIPGVYPAIIDRTMFQRVSGSRKPPGRRGKMFGNLLTGMVRCMSCGSSMTLTKQGWPDKSLYCGAVLRRLVDGEGKRVCEQTWIQYPQLETGIITLASTLTRAQEFGPLGSDEAKVRECIETILATIRNAEQRIADTLDAMDAAPSPTVVKWIAKTEAEITGSKSEITRLEGKLRVAKARTNNRDYEELIRLAATADDEKDIEKRFAIRSNIHGILSRCVDHIEIDARQKHIIVWLGGGLICSATNMGKTTTLIVRGKRSFVVMADGEVEEVETPPTILAQHRRMLDGRRMPVFVQDD